MRALRKTQAAFGLEFADLPPPPPPGPGEVVVSVAAVGICGSDVHAYEWTEGYGFMVPHLPLTMGHEFAGTITRNGIGSGFEEGERVTVIPFVACGACAACRAQRRRWADFVAAGTSARADGSCFAAASGSANRDRRLARATGRSDACRAHDGSAGSTNDL